MLRAGPVEALVVRKPIKNLHLSVLPPYGKVRVTAPVGMRDDAIRVLLATKLGWIKRQQAKFRAQERQTRREYVSGESHYLFGKRYRLQVVPDGPPARVELKRQTKLILHVRPGATTERCAEIMTEWYRVQLRKVIEPMIEKWQERIGVHSSSWRIMRMKTRWGTCNQKTGRILLNLELAKKPVSCIEYVVVHELVHLIEKKHNDRFTELMTRLLPKWRHEKEELNRFVLSHEEWDAKPLRTGPSCA